MAYRTGGSGRSIRDRKDERRLKYVLDAGFLTVDLDDDDSSSCSDSEDAGESTRWAGVAASFRVLSDSLLRMERAESEMAKAREALRLEAEKRRAESEVELTQMVLRTQLQMASFLSRPSQGRKRKRVEDDKTTTQVVSHREGSLVSSMLQCNLLF